MRRIGQLISLKGRRALITGATGGLGRIMADTLAELGADLLFIDRAGSGFEDLENNIQKRWQVKTISMACDLESEVERNEMIDAVKADGLGLNILINNAAFVGTSDLNGWAVPFEQQTLGTWRRAMEVNLTAIFHLCQAFTPDLRAAEGGNIVNIGSIYGYCGPDWSLYEGTSMGNPAAYGVSKGGLIQLTRWLASTVAPSVRVNTISPGGIFRNQPDTFVQRYVDKTPLARMAVEDDIRGAIAFLASDMSRYVTGQNLSIDGGWTI